MSLIRIGESLHCHIPTVRTSARGWILGDEIAREAGDRHLCHLVRSQVAAGADFLDVNVDDFLTDEQVGASGARDLLARILRLIVTHGDGVPPCIDSSDPGLLEFGLQFYHGVLGGQRRPLLNSVTVNRLDLLRFRSRLPFAVVGMLLERAGDSSAGFTDIADAAVYHETAATIHEAARQAGCEPDDIFFDPTVGPLGADMVGYTRRTFEGIQQIRQDKSMAGAHVVLGLSNCSDGLPRRLSINRAYLRVAMEYGVDAAICDAAKVTGKDLCDGRLLRLVRKVASGDTSDALMLLVDYAQSQPRAPAAPAPPPVADPFGAALHDDDQRVFLLELAPSEGNVNEMFALAEQARDDDWIFTITDTPGGNRTPGPDTLALEVARRSGRQPITNLSCKSDDRNGLLRRAIGLYKQGLHHFFAVTGDYPTQGRPVFDLDAVTLTMALDALRRGLDYPDWMPRSGGALSALRIGAAVSPFKYREADLWGQYLKAWKKRAAGADYLITQLGYDVAKFKELRLWMQRAGIDSMPVIPMVYFLTPQFLRVLNRVHVAGAVVPDDLKKKIEGRLDTPEQKRQARQLNFTEWAARQRQDSVRRAALLSHILLDGLQCKGIDLAGITDLDDARAMRDELASLQQRNWLESWEEYRAADGSRTLDLSPGEDAFYLFPFAADGLPDDGPLNSADRDDYAPPHPRMERLHRQWFEPEGLFHGLLRGAMKGDESTWRGRAAALLEAVTKGAQLGCEMCGDCRIPELAYLCPEPTRGCAKRLLNGPCAGADLDGGCEVHPDRRCYWGRVIEAQLKAGDISALQRLQPPKDPALQHTSSWRNEIDGRTGRGFDVGELPQLAQPSL